MQKILRILAGAVLKKYRPRVVAVTGSVGKTTAKEMIFRTLSGGKLKVWKSRKNYNNELGIPLAILGISGEKKSWWGWLSVLLRAGQLIIFPNDYADVLVLELAADSRGDIKYFCSFIPIEAGVVTNIGISHLEKFGSREAIFKEKTYLLKKAKEIAIYNKDSLEVDSLNLRQKTCSYACEKKADFKADDISYFYGEDERLPQGLIFTVKHQEKSMVIKLRGLFGRGYVYGALAGLAVAQYFAIDLEKAKKRLEKTKPLSAHLEIVQGRKGVIIVNDVYNSAPDSLREALRLVKDLPAERRWLVLGDMLELGEFEDSAHREIGELLSLGEKNFILITVGERMKLAGKEYQGRTGNKFFAFVKAGEAGRWLRKQVRKGDVVLAKGSRGMKMEKVVKELVTEKKAKIKNS